MGYTSDVGLCLTSTGKEELDKVLQAAEQAGNHALEDIRGLLQCAKFQLHDESGAVAFYWEWIKWYPDYDDVGFIEAFLHSLDSDDYFFIRVGESNDDTEERGNLWENPFKMYLTRAIIFDNAPAATAA
jgi:hypothetical protein